MQFIYCAYLQLCIHFSKRIILPNKKQSNKAISNKYIKTKQHHLAVVVVERLHACFNNLVLLKGIH